MNAAQHVSDQTKVAHDIDDARRLLQEWYASESLHQDSAVLHGALEALLRAVATLARRVDQLEDSVS